MLCEQSDVNPASRYDIGKSLGCGNYGEVYQVSSVHEDQDYACKKLTAAITLRPTTVKDLERLLDCNHKNLVQVADVMLDDNALHVITELMPTPVDGVSPDLYSWLLEEAPVGLGHARATEGEVASIVHQIASGIAYLNSRGMMHGNLRLENVLLGPAGISELKLTDFGLSFMEREQTWGGEARIAADGYAAPETLDDMCIFSRASIQADVFALGVIMFTLIAKRSPFGFADGANKRISSGGYTMDPADWNGVSEEAKQLVVSMLETDPADRSTIKQVLEAEWVTSNLQVPLWLLCGVVYDAVRCAAELEGRQDGRDPFRRFGASDHEVTCSVQHI